MWSIANEPRTQQVNADQYFGEVARYTKQLDPTRPITAAIAVDVNHDEAAKHLDIVSFNRYNAWYQNTGRLDMVTSYVVKEATSWHEVGETLQTGKSPFLPFSHFNSLSLSLSQKHDKPILMSEYGSDTVEGLHLLPAYVWSEEFQSQQFSKHFEAFDTLRAKGFFIGEFVWNFADFKTAQSEFRDSE